MSMRSSLEAAATAVLVVCALGVTVMIARRELFATNDPGASLQPKKIKDWRRFDAGIKTIGSRTAPVSVIVFSDFQCPFCARLAHSLDRVRATYPDQVRIVFRNFPIESLHPHAKAAAAAAECSAGQGRFAPLHDLLFQHPDSIGIWQWKTVAERAGIPDIGRFEDCLTSNATTARLGEDSAAAITLGLTGTPTVLINSWLLRSGAPTDSVLDALLRSELARGGR